jgi:hypothetical protein
VSVSSVNGYLCTSSCDEVKARAGKDPHPKTVPAGDQTAGTSGAERGAAVIFGGLLAALGATSATRSSTATAADPNEVNGQAAKNQPFARALDISV